VNSFIVETSSILKAQLEKPKPMNPKKEAELIMSQLENLKEQRVLYDK